MRANIEAERGRMCMTKTALCAELGITLKTYNGYIRGAAIPSDILERLSDITGCSMVRIQQDGCFGLVDKSGFIQVLHPSEVRPYKEKSK